MNELNKINTGNVTPYRVVTLFTPNTGNILLTTGTSFGNVNTGVFGVRLSGSFHHNIPYISGSRLVHTI